MGIRNKSSKKKRIFAAYLRRNLTFPEKILWSRLKDNKIGVRVYSQQLVYGFVADLNIPSAKTIIEIDGPTHLVRKSYDANRDAILLKYGIKTMRFTAQEVINNTAAVVALISDRVNKRLKR